MASRLSQVAASLLTSIFFILSLVFSLLAITSKEWAVRHNYDPKLNPLDWHTPIYTLYRSPFKICSAELVSGSGSNSTAADFRVKCHRFRAYGFNRTSCELAIATQDDTAITTGDARLCQQIHYAGNFWIASTAFIGTAFLFAVVLAGFTLMRRPRHAKHHDAEPSHKEPTQADEGSKHHHHSNGEENHAPSSSRKHRSGWVRWTAWLLLIFTFVGFVTALIGQYYGILGLIQSLPNNSDFASSSAGSRDDVNTQGNHGPWFQGRGLSVYATCSWGFAIAAGIIASRSWPLPQWRVALE